MVRRAYFRGWAPVTLVAIFACTEDPVARVQSLLQIQPDTVDFGEGCVGEVSLEAVTVFNRGLAVADLEQIFIEPPGAPFEAPARPAPLSAGSSVELMIGFRPTQPNTLSTAELVLITRDGAEARATLRGNGGIRRLSSVPESIDFGVVNEGSPTVRTLSFRNVGGSLLTIREVVWTSTSMDLMPVADTFRGGLVLPKSSAQYELLYDPKDVGADQGLVVVRSDDPDRPELEIPVVGRANLRPKVRLWGCTEAESGGRGCSPMARAVEVSAGFDETVELDGRDGQDPEGDSIRYMWSVPTRPPNSIAAVFPDDPPTTGDVQIDRAGVYVVRLEVADARGLSSLPAEVLIRPRDLEVSLRWDLATDVDLHLVRPQGSVGDYGNGTPGRSRGTDCCTFNRAPNWNDLGSPFDDPRLERDSVTSAGPEVVGLDRPERGRYRVYAHYCDSRNVRLATEARFEVASRGQAVAQLGPVVLQPGELWAAADLVWDAATETLSVEPISGPPSLRPEICRSP